MAQLHRDSQPNMVVKEGSVTVIGKAITASDYALKKDRARAAYQQKDSVCTQINLAANDKETVVTHCCIYNATGDKLKFVCSKVWSGEKIICPQEIGNGQGGLFLHAARPADRDGSIGAVVYRVKDVNGNESDWMCAWENSPEKNQSKNRAYTEIREVDHFNDSVWPIVRHRLHVAGRESTDTGHGCVGSVYITEGSSACFDAVITLDD